MELRTEVLTLVKEEQDTELLVVIKELLLSHRSDWWEKIGKKERESVERGMTEAARGEGIPHNEAMRPYRKWL